MIQLRARMAAKLAQEVRYLASSNYNYFKEKNIHNPSSQGKQSVNWQSVSSLEDIKQLVSSKIFPLNFSLPYLKEDSLALINAINSAKPEGTYDQFIFEALSCLDAQAAHLLNFTDISEQHRTKKQLLQNLLEIQVYLSRNSKPHKGEPVRLYLNPHLLKYSLSYPQKFCQFIDFIKINQQSDDISKFMAALDHLDIHQLLRAFHLISKSQIFREKKQYLKEIVSAKLVSLKRNNLNGLMDVGRYLDCIIEMKHYLLQFQPIARDLFTLFLNNLLADQNTPLQLSYITKIFTNFKTSLAADLAPAVLALLQQINKKSQDLLWQPTPDYLNYLLELYRFLGAQFFVGAGAQKFTQLYQDFLHTLLAPGRALVSTLSPCNQVIALTELDEFNASQSQITQIV